MRTNLLLVFILAQLFAIGQSTGSSISAGFSPGFLLAHRADLKNIESHIAVAEVLYQQNKSNTQWGQQYNKPVTGHGISLFLFGREETGFAINLQSSLKLKVGHLFKSDVNFRLSSGIAYLSKIFDPYANPKNLAIGSHLNGFMQTALLINRTFDQSQIEYGLCLSHLSNGAFTVPNLGYNMPGLMVRYAFQVKDAEPADKNIKRIKKYDKYHWKYSVTFLYAHKERDFAKPVAFNHWGMQLRARSQSNPIKSWRMGIDMMLDKSYIYAADNLANLDDITFSEKLEMGIAAGHEWSAGSVRLLGEIGVYLYNPTDLKRPMYQRMGFCYDITEQLGLQGTLKFHRGVADYMEWGLKYTMAK